VCCRARWIGPDPMAGRAGMVRELLEREQAVAALEVVLVGLRSGRGRAVLIEGPAGVGKTALLDEAQRRAEGLCVLRASGGEFERDLALGALRELFEPVLWRATESQRARWLGGPSEIVGRVLGTGAPDSAARGFSGIGPLCSRGSIGWQLRLPRIRRCCC
jgi:AAA ATPase domain